MALSVLRSELIQIWNRKRFKPGEGTSYISHTGMCGPCGWGFFLQKYVHVGVFLLRNIWRSLSVTTSSFTDIAMLIGRDVQNRESLHLGITFFVGNCIVSWSSKKQSTVALSSCEAEYVALCGAGQEVVWLRSLLADIGFPQKRPTVVGEDNQGALCLAKNPKDHNRTKHIDIKYHYTRQLICSNQLEIEYIPTGKMIADTMTKGLPKPKFVEFRSSMGVQRC